MVREHTEKVKPPRALFVPFPFGHALGRANDPELQHRVLRAAVDARPIDAARPNFIRYCADDLKALYFEAYMIKTPAAGGDEITRWFWAETAVGQLLRRVRDRLDASDDPAAKAAAFGVAR